jgi:hypothetical protein
LDNDDQKHNEGDQQYGSTDDHHVTSLRGEQSAARVGWRHSFLRGEGGQQLKRNVH